MATASPRRSRWSWRRCCSVSSAPSSTSLLGTSPVFLLVLGFVGVLATCVTAYFEYQARHRAPRRGEAVGTAQPVNVTALRRPGRPRPRPARPARLAPVPIILAAVFAGVDGAVSAAIGLVLVAANFLVAARLITWTAERSPGAVMGVVLGGYIVRMAVLFGIALALGQLSFIDLPVLVLTIAVVHLVFLAWETRHVSLSLAAPASSRAARTNPATRSEDQVSVLGAFTFPPIDELFRWKDIVFEDSSVRDQQDRAPHARVVVADRRDLRRRQPAMKMRAERHAERARDRPTSSSTVASRVTSSARTPPASRRSSARCSSSSCS